MTSPTTSVPVQQIAQATLDKAKRDGLFPRLRPATVVEPTSLGQPQVSYDDDEGETAVRVASLIGPLPQGARVMAVVTEPAGNHVVGYQGAPDGWERLIGYHRRVTNRTGITTEVGHMRIDGMSVVTGHLYRFRFTGVSFSAVSTRVILRVRGSTTGTATTASTVFGHAVVQTTAVASTGGTRECTAHFEATADGMLSALASIQADASINTHNADTESPNVFTVEDLGLIGNTVAAGVNL